MPIAMPRQLRVMPAGVLILFLFSPRLLSAQQADIPPAAPEQQDTQTSPSEQDRIVDGRPLLYGVRKTLQPFSWLATGVRPMLRGMEKVSIPKKSTDSASDSFGIKLGVRGHGQGSGLGPEVKFFHRDLFHKGIKAEVPLSVTYKRYQLARFKVEFPVTGIGGQQVGFEWTGRYASRPSENFFGIGNEASAGDKAEYRAVWREGGAGVITRMSDSWSLRLGALYRSIGITRPRNFRSASDVFRDEPIPGLTVDPAAAFFVTTASLQHDTRDDANLSSRGGLQLAEASLNEAQTGGDFSYWAYRGELQQFFSLSDNGRNVIGIRGSIETNQPKGGSTIPFYVLPFIGSYSTLRGFENRRFVDRSAVMTTLEYRYRIWRHFDWGFFIDQAEVAPEVRNFAWDRLHRGYGMRFVVRARENRAFIIDMARSREEPFKLYVDFSPLF